MCSSGNQPMHSCNLSASSSESSSESSMPDPFSRSTKSKIRVVCRSRCVICLRRVGYAGQCSHILDSADEGEQMVTYGTAIGVLAPNYSRSAAGNGVILCSSCHQDLFAPHDIILSPPRQVLEYLIAFVRARNPRPIHEVLHSLVCSPPPYPDFGLPDPQSVLPFLGLYTLIALHPQRLENVDFHIYMEAELSEPRDGHWTSVLPNTTPNMTARIYDAISLPPTDHNPGCDLQLSAMLNNQQRYWRLPTEITPILTHLLYSVANFTGSDIEEIRLAIELHSLLALRSLESQGPSSGPVVGGGDPDAGSKRGHDRGQDGPRARKRGRHNPSHLAKGGACGSAQADIPSNRLRFSSEMTSHEIIFAARGIILY